MKSQTKTSQKRTCILENVTQTEQKVGAKIIKVGDG